MTSLPALKIDSRTATTARLRKRPQKNPLLIAIGVACGALVIVGVLFQVMSNPSRKKHSKTRSQVASNTSPRPGGSRKPLETPSGVALPKLPDPNAILADLQRDMQGLQRDIQRPSPTPSTPPPTPQHRKVGQKQSDKPKSTTATPGSGKAVTNKGPSPVEASAQAASSPETPSSNANALSADYTAMIRDANQRTCSEVLCSLERFVGNGSVVPIPGRSDVPLKTIAENRSGVISGGPTPDSSTYKWPWTQDGARVPLKRWLEVCGPTQASPLQMHEPGFDKWDLDGLKTSHGHMGELVEVPYKCVDGVLYLIGCINEMPGFGKILNPKFMLLVPSADAAKRAEGNKLKARFQLVDTRPVLSEYEKGIAQGRLVAINASQIAAHSAEYRDEAAAKFWFETVPKFEESAKHSEFFRGYLHGMIEQWKKEGLPVLR